MDLATLRTFVWDSLESDSAEISSSLLNTFLRDAARKIDDYQDRWTFRAVEYTFITAPADASYDLDTYPGLVSPAPLKRIVAVNGQTRLLGQGDHRREREVRAATSGQTGTPQVWTLWGRRLHLWPAPSAAISHTVVGYRRMSDWVSTNAAPDFPAEFHDLLGWWALSRAHAFLDNAGMAKFYADEFYTELANRASGWLNNPSSQPFIINGGSPSLAQYQLGPLQWPASFWG